MSSSKTIDSHELLNIIDSEYQQMSHDEQMEMRNNPEKLEKFTAKAMNNELINNFSLVFKLPKTVRKKIFQESAEQLRQRASNRSPEEIKMFFDSPGGRGALKGAAHFFLMELSGRQKAETTPLANEIFKIMGNTNKKE